MDQEDQEPVCKNWLTILRSFGYAPGDYLIKCRHCDKQVMNVDKRAVCCRECAENMALKVFFTKEEHKQNQAEKKLYKFAIFQSNEEFVEWQKNNDVTIYQASPIVKEAPFEQCGDTVTKLNSISYAIFVFYMI